jgi:hypothetical protein
MSNMPDFGELGKMFNVAPEADKAFDLGKRQRVPGLDKAWAGWHKMTGQDKKEPFTLKKLLPGNLRKAIAEQNQPDLSSCDDLVKALQADGLKAKAVPFENDMPGIFVDEDPDAVKQWLVERDLTGHLFYAPNEDGPAPVIGPALALEGAHVRDMREQMAEAGKIALGYEVPDHEDGKRPKLSQVDEATAEDLGLEEDLSVSPTL